MTPREVYITRLPGHTGSVYVRKRAPQQPRRKLSLLAEAFGQPRRYYTAKPVRVSSFPSEERHVMEIPSWLEVEQLRPDYPVMVRRMSEPGRVLGQQSRDPSPAFAEIVRPTRTRYITRRPCRITEPTLRHTCASCGKFRSSSYEHRHPLAKGETPKPTMCEKCISKQTSSEESADSHRGSRKKKDYYRLRRRWTASTGDRISEFERGRPRHLASKRSRMHNSRRLSSDEEPRVSITYDGARSRRTTSEYSPEGRKVRVIRRIQYVDSQGRQSSRSRSRSRSRSVSRRRYKRIIGFETASSEESGMRVRIRRVPSRSRSRSRRPLRIVRSRDTSSIDDDYEHIYTPTEVRRPNQVGRVIEVEDDRASFRSGVHRRPASMIVEPGTTYAATQVDADLKSHYGDPVEIVSISERMERPPSRSVRIVQVSPETQDSICRNRISETVDSQRVFYEPRPPPIITRQTVEPAFQTVTETNIVEPRAAPITETHTIDRRKCRSGPVSETHIVERRGRSRTPVTERRVVERRDRSPSRVYQRHVETRSRSRSRPVMSERDFRTQSPSSVYGRHTMESEPSRRERRHRVKTAGHHRLTDSSDEYSPQGMPSSTTLRYQTDSPKSIIVVPIREDPQAPILVYAASSR